MKFFRTSQIAEVDQFTIENEPIADIDLMERAALQITNWIVENYSNEVPFVFFAGFGNNGGDALAIARQISNHNFQCKVYLLDLEKPMSASTTINWQRLIDQKRVELFKISEIEDSPDIDKQAVVVDGLFGSGLTRPLQELPADLVKNINSLENEIIAIDVPSGLMGEDNSQNDWNSIVRADYTLTLQFPKLSFLFPENEQFVGDWLVLPIGLHPKAIEQAPTPYHLLERKDIQPLIKERSKYDHKGNNGHALLIAGNYGKMGAALIASKACLRAGAGLLTTHIPQCGYEVLQTAVPEAMVQTDENLKLISSVSNVDNYSAIAVGPGIGQEQETSKTLYQLIIAAKTPMVIDADGINILSQNKSWLKELPQNTILTPHLGEFKRLVGNYSNSYDKIQQQINFSAQHQLIIVLKGAYTSISLPDGDIYFNSTGNSGMATAGSGDALTGIILSLLTQGYTPKNAAIAGVYLHGLAGDIALQQESQQSLITSDIIKNIGRAYTQINGHLS